MENSFDCGARRTPLKALNTNTVCTSAVKSIDLSSKLTHGSYSMSNTDLLQARIEHLERERLDMSMQLHQRDEKERSRTILIKSLEQSRDELEHSLDTAKKSSSALKSQVEDLEIQVGVLTNQVEVHKSKAATTEGLWNKMTTATRELRRVEEENAVLRQEKEASAAQLATNVKIIAALREENAEAKRMIEVLEAARESSKCLVDEFTRRQAELEQENSELTASNRAAIASKLEITVDYEKLLADNASTKEALAAAMREMEILRSSKASQDLVHGDLVSESNLTAIVAELRESLRDSEKKRRQLHNTLQELRGNIRVFVRCRPFLRGDAEEFDNSSSSHEAGCIKFNADGNSVSLTNTQRGSGQVFAFDHIFRPDSNQKDVFNEVSEFVQSALDGYRVCIFSYGQTGSGKTHTMTGGQQEASRGITPRSVEQIILQIISMRSNGWEVSMSASMVELYNEELRDLLVPPQTSASAKLKILYQQGRVSVVGLSAVDIDSGDLRTGMNQLESLLDLANKNRSTACTAMNEVSSRSHALFMLDLVCKHSDGVTVMRGGLRLCDLAGSERLDRTGTLMDAARLKETVNINKSLSCLADVFSALSNKGPHVPYRNSKLTMLLQDCLSGDGKSLMIVNVSPTVASSHETLCSLRFATQVCKVELGKAQKNVYITTTVPAPAPVPTPPPAPAPALALSLPAPILSVPAPTSSTFSATLTASSLTHSIGNGAVRVPSSSSSSSSSSLDMPHVAHQTIPPVQASTVLQHMLPPPASPSSSQSIPASPIRSNSHSFLSADQQRPMSSTSLSRPTLSSARRTSVMPPPPVSALGPPAPPRSFHAPTLSGSMTGIGAGQGPSVTMEGPALSLGSLLTSASATFLAAQSRAKRSSVMPSSADNSTDPFGGKRPKLTGATQPLIAPTSSARTWR